MPANKRIIFIITSLLFVSVAIFVFYKNNSRKVLGTETDEHGCNISRGAAWCDTEQRCIQQKWETCTDEKTVITNLIGNFYKKYNLCLGSPPVQAKGNIGEYCQKNTGYTSANFYNNLVNTGTSARGLDPISCTKSTPKSNFINSVEINGNTAQALNEEDLGNGKLISHIAVVKEENIWKVDNVFCPGNP